MKPSIPMTTFVLLLSLGLAAAYPTPALAWKQNKHDDIGIRWPDSAIPVSWYLSSAGSKDIRDGSDRQEVIRGFNAWQEPPCSNFSVKAPLTIAPTQHKLGLDGENQVFWAERADEWRFGSQVLGVTQPFLNRNSGEIIDADIAFNGVNYRWDTSGNPPRGQFYADVFSIAVHEQGHFLGLDHSCGEHNRCSRELESSVMVAYYNGVKRGLSPDDIAGVCSVYPGPPRAKCESCNQYTQCDSPQLHCSEGPAGERCRQTCQRDADCMSGRCLPSSGLAANLCACEGDLRDEGELCDADYQCDSHLWCTEHQGEKRCRIACTAGGDAMCASGESCQSLDGRMSCAPAPIQTGNNGISGGDGGFDGSDGRFDDGLLPPKSKLEGGCGGCGSTPGLALWTLLGLVGLLPAKRARGRR